MRATILAATAGEAVVAMASLLDLPRLKDRAAEQRTEILLGGASGSLTKPHRGVAPGEFSARRFLVRFVLSSVVVLGLVSIVTAIVSRRTSDREAIADARRLTSLMAKGIVEPLLTDSMLSGDPTALREFDDAMQRLTYLEPLVRMKVWTPEGKVIYSDDPRLIGSSFALEAQELEILETGEILAEISDLVREENQLEQGYDQLVEVYIPVRAANGDPIVFEAYFDNAEVAAAGRRIWLEFAPLALGGLVLLQLVQLPLSWILAKRVERTQRERERLFHHALESSDAERRRIASDLHDGVVQDLTGVSYALAATARRPGGADDTVIDGAATRLREAIRSLRSLLVEIYPPNLHEEGLDSALGDLLAKLELRGMTTKLMVAVDTSELPTDSVRLLYRAAQEALRNVVAHANASSVEILIKRTGRSAVTLIVSDDGVGFDPATRSAEGHVGLLVLGGIVADAGGELAIASAPGRGTTLRAEVPSR
jgi:two-component system, NarL family, sensor kinase